IRTELLQDLPDNTLRLLQKGQDDVFEVELAMLIAQQNLLRSGNGILRALGETIKSHHQVCLFLFPTCQRINRLGSTSRIGRRGIPLNSFVLPNIGTSKV